jgi:glycosyltransferase involved in cell wall biosynthesis
VAFDASCLVEQPLTGVGYYTLHQLRALLQLEGAPRLRLVASSAQPVPPVLRELGAAAASFRMVRCPTRLKVALWTRAGWPPVEWFAGPVDIAHGGFHLLPAARRTVRRVVTVFDLSGLRRPETHSAANLALQERLLRHAAGRADALVAISQSCKEDAVELLGADPARVHVVYGGVFLEEFGGALPERLLAETRARLGIPGDYLIHLGTLEPRKNLPRLLEAYARVCARVPDCPMLVLAGRKGWMYDAVFETIERLRIGARVVHTGYLSREEAVALLRGAAGCVYPSLYEGFGLPVLEAMAARTPVLTSNVSSMPEVIGDCGITVAPESTDEIEAGLESLVRDRDAALARVDRAYRRAARFTWENSARSLTGVYARLLEGSA